MLTGNIACVKRHDLKSWTGLFEPIYKGEKTHELRVLDRDYKIGDRCLLREYDPLKKEYTGRKCWVEITYITSSQHQECAFSPFALHPAMGVLSIKRIEDPK
jgi:hypothetical protein